MLKTFSSIPLGAFLLTLLLVSDLDAVEELSLNDCLALAQKESESIKSSNLSTDMAQCDVDTALLTAFPIINVSAQVLKLDFKDITPLEFMGTIIPMEMPEYANQVSVTFAQPISQIYGIHKAYGIRKQLVEIETLKAEMAKNRVSVRVVDYFYSYQTLSQLEHLFEEVSQQLDIYMKQADSFIENGMAEKNARYRIEVEQARNAKNIEQAKSNRAIIKKALALLMNRDETDFELPPP